jgi:hypothetical protein
LTGDWFVVRTYYLSPPLLPDTVYLRTGSPTWGYQHIESRFNPWFDGMIAVTVRTPTKMTHDGSTQVRILKIRDCPQPYNLRVVIQTAGTPKHGVQKGIITAYQEFV